MKGPGLQDPASGRPLADVVYICGTAVCARRADGSGARLELLDVPCRSGAHGAIVEMEVSLITTFEPGPILARVRVSGLAGRGFDITPDAQRFLVQRAPVDEDQGPRLLVVQNWR